MPACTICTRYKTLVGNAKQVRRDGHAPGVEMTLDEFAAWFTSQDRICVYCGVDETVIAKLGIRTQVGHLLQRLGLDRLDATRGYAVGNLALCCFACNKVKSNTFSYDEMQVLGVAVAAVWRQRLDSGDVDPELAAA